MYRKLLANKKAIAALVLLLVVLSFVIMWRVWKSSGVNFEQYALGQWKCKVTEAPSKGIPQGSIIFDIGPGTWTARLAFPKKTLASGNWAYRNGEAYFSSTTSEDFFDVKGVPEQITNPTILNVSSGVDKFIVILTDDSFTVRSNMGAESKDVSECVRQ